MFLKKTLNKAMFQRMHYLKDDDDAEGCTGVIYIYSLKTFKTCISPKKYSLSPVTCKDIF